MLREDYELFEGLPADELVFTDTSFLETLVFAARAGIAVGPGVQRWLGRKRYAAVFFLAPLNDYERSEVRTESRAVALHISDQVLGAYRRYGYEPVVVPPASVEERLAFIEARLDGGSG